MLAWLKNAFEEALAVGSRVSTVHMATNHLRCIATGDGGFQRYHTLSARLSAANGNPDAKAAMHLLSEVAQSGTQWSVAYNMTSGDVSVVIGQPYKTDFPFHLERLRP